MARALRKRATEITARKFRVPRQIDALCDHGEERAHPGTEAVWERVQDFYRSGMHPGIQVCIYYRGEVVLERAIGHARGVRPGARPPKDAMPMRVDTPANVFSAAKAVASVVMHKLHADNAVDLDVPVATYLPGFEQGGKEAITLREIINHQAGIPALPPAAFDLDLLSDADAIEAFMLELTPSRKRDGAPAYHAISGGFVMDAVVRRVLGKSMRDVLSEQFKQPLGLRWFDFGVSPRDEPKVAHNVATGIRLGPLLGRVMNRLLGIPWDEAVELSNDPRFLCGVIPSGNLITTARDAATFYQCLMNLGELNGVRVMDADVVRELIYDPQARVRVDRMLGMPMRYGNGFMTGTDTISLYGWNHPRAFGHIGMSNTFTWADPDRELAVALLTTGKPVLGTHLLAFPRLMSEIHRVFT